MAKVRYTFDGQPGTADEADLRKWMFENGVTEDRVKIGGGEQSTIGKKSPGVDFASNPALTYTKDGKDQTVPPGDLASKLESEGWTRKYPGGVTGALRSAGAALGDMVPFSGGMPEMAGGVEGTVNWLRGKGDWAPEVVKATNEYKDLYASTRRENPGLWAGTNLATQ